MKKKFNYNFILFIAAAVLIVGGWLSRPLLSGVKYAVSELMHVFSVTEFIANVDTASEEVSYKSSLIDLNSILYRITDTRVVEKEDASVVRLDNDYLAYTKAGFSDETLEWMADQSDKLKEVTDELGIPCMMVIAPTKECYTELCPEGVNPDCRGDVVEFVALLRERGHDVLYLAEAVERQGTEMEELFFVTDHHWLPETGLWAAGEIFGALEAHYGFEYDHAIVDPSNYQATVYENWFLGSQGKKVGRFFTPCGVDDFHLLLPTFETQLTVTDPHEVRSGSFADSVIYMRHLEEKDLYNLNPYAAYSGGDFPLQVMENSLASGQGKKILIIRDSFACAVTPFLSLGTEALHIADSRYWGATENAETILDYIRYMEPDYVLTLFSGVSPDTYNFG